MGDGDSGVRVVGPVAAIAASDYERGVIAIGDNRVRQAIASTIGLIWLNAIHPRACIDASAAIGPGTVVCAGAIVQPDAVIGAHAIINTGVIVEHDCQIGDWRRSPREHAWPAAFGSMRERSSGWAFP